MLKIFRTDRGHNGLSIKTIDRSSPLPRSIETIDSSLSQDPACASLLPKPDTDERYNNNLFGQFKGFTITPIRSQAKSLEPTKPAPPPPTIPTVAIKTNIKPIPRSNNRASTCILDPPTTSFDEAPPPPTLPPLNPGCTARPLISSPVLAATTCTSVELVAPKLPAVEGPTRPAPAPPVLSTSDSVQKPQRPSSTPLANVLEGERRQEKGSSTLNRIASILRPNSGIVRGGGGLQTERSATNSLPRLHHHKASKVMDKEILRSLEISNPIPQKEIEIPTPSIPVIPVDEQRRGSSGGSNVVVLRAQSMRDGKIARPAIQTFGSMRQAAVKRPTSIPASARPTAPPPGPPVLPSAEKATSEAKIPGLPGYQNPRAQRGGQQRAATDNAYDDCMNLVPDASSSSSSSLAKIAEESAAPGDNIYAVIEEALPEKGRKGEKQGENEYKLPKRVENSSSNVGVESMGLLSEIVSEISNRNFDSIYSTATLSRKTGEEGVGGGGGGGGSPRGRRVEGEEGEEEGGGYNNSGPFAGYTNGSVHYKSPAGSSIYSNSASAKFNSSSSTTSSGYLNPSALNVPQQAEDEGKGSRMVNDSKLSDEMSRELGTKVGEDRKSIARARFNSRGVSRGGEEEAKACNRSKQYSDSGSKQQGSVDDGGEKDSRASVNSRLSLKTVPCSSPKDNEGGKFVNSPDLVSSCSNSSSQIGTKSPDVVGNNPKISPKNAVQKTPTLARGGGAKAPATPAKPLNIAPKGAGLAERKKSSPSGGGGGNVNAIKSSFSVAARESASKISQAKAQGGQRAEAKGDSGAKANPVQRAASSKSNVASLQQKFEANRNVNASRTIPGVHKAQRTVGKTVETASVKK